MGIFAYFAAFKSNQDTMIGVLKEIRDLLKEIRDFNKDAEKDLEDIREELKSPPEPPPVVGIAVKPNTPQTK